MIVAMEYEGKVYTAQPDPAADCGGDSMHCAFYDDLKACMANDCTPHGSVDGERIGRHIIWIEAAK